MAQWLACLSCNWWMPVGVELEPPSKASVCFIEQETLSSLLSTGLFQERIRA